MHYDRIKFALIALRAAAQHQGDQPYDHKAALWEANVHERGDDLTPLAAAWARAIPGGHRTLVDYESAEKPTGRDMAFVYEKAASIHIEEMNLAREDSDRG